MGIKNKKYRATSRLISFVCLASIGSIIANPTGWLVLFNLILIMLILIYLNIIVTNLETIVLDYENAQNETKDGASGNRVDKST